MRKALVCGGVIAMAACLAQNSDDPNARTQVTVAATGGGVRAFWFSSEGATGPPVKNAPFSADILDEHVQTLSDGNHIRSSSSGKMYRDSEGRTRNEQTISLVGPWATSGQKQTLVMIIDPVAGVSYDLDEQRKIARKMPAGPLPPQLPPPPGASGKVTAIGSGAIGLSMAQSDVVMLKQKLASERGNGDVKTEDLGTRTMEGVPCQGTRVTITIPAGAMGNETPIETVTERWTSPDLQTLVLTTNHDPRMGDNTHQLQNIVRGDPPSALFEVPEGYQIVDEHALPGGAAVTIAK